MNGLCSWRAKGDTAAVVDDVEAVVVVVVVEAVEMPVEATVVVAAAVAAIKVTALEDRLGE